MKFIVGLIRRHLGMFMAGICFLAVEAMADLMQPALMSRIVDEGVKYQDTRRIWMYGGFMLLVAGGGCVWSCHEKPVCQQDFPDDWQGAAQ